MFYNVSQTAIFIMIFILIQDHKSQKFFLCNINWIFRPRCVHMISLTLTVAVATIATIGPNINFELLLVDLKSGFKKKKCLIFYASIDNGPFNLNITHTKFKKKKKK